MAPCHAVHGYEVGEGRGAGFPLRPTITAPCEGAPCMHKRDSNAARCPGREAAARGIRGRMVSPHRGQVDKLFGWISVLWNATTVTLRVVTVSVSLEHQTRGVWWWFSEPWEPRRTIDDQAADRRPKVHTIRWANREAVYVLKCKQR